MFRAIRYSIAVLGRIHSAKDTIRLQRILGEIQHLVNVLKYVSSKSLLQPETSISWFLPLDVLSKMSPSAGDFNLMTPYPRRFVENVSFSRRLQSHDSFPLLSAPHSLFSIWIDLKSSEKIAGAPIWRWRKWIWLTGPSGLHRNFFINSLLSIFLYMLSLFYLQSSYISWLCAPYTCHVMVKRRNCRDRSVYRKYSHNTLAWSNHNQFKEYKKSSATVESGGARCHQ